MAAGGLASCLHEESDRFRLTSDAVRKQERGIHELINDNISILTRWMLISFKGKTVFPILLIPCRSQLLPLAEMAVGIMHTG